MGDFVKAKFMHQTTVEKKNTHAQWVEKKHETLRKKKVLRIHKSQEEKFLVYEKVKKRMPVSNHLHPPPLPEIWEG